MKKANTHSHSYPHPSTFASGGVCNIRQSGAHFHAELAPAGSFDTNAPHIFTFDEQNALVFLVYRNRQKFQKFGPRAPGIIMVPDVDPDTSGYDKLEENLGTQATTLLEKVYRLIPDQHIAPYTQLCRMVNSVDDYEQKRTMIKIIPNLSAAADTIFDEFRDKPGVRKVHMFFLTHEHVQLLEKMYDELFKVHRRKQDGVANYTRCMKFKHENFPKMKSAAPSHIRDEAIGFLDDLSTVLIEGSIVFNEPDKQSAGGWRIWKTDQADVYLATLYTTGVNTITGSKTTEAMVMACNGVGLKAKQQYNPKIEKSTALVALTCEQLQEIDREAMKETLGSMVHTHVNFPSI